MSSTNKFLDKLLHEDDDVPSQKEEDDHLGPLLTEISMIEDETIRQFVRSVLLRADYCFWTIPASFSGKYHPPDERSEGGNIYHIQRVCRMVQFMCTAYNRSPIETDILLAAALLHDCTKGVDNGQEIGYDPMHPYTVDALVDSVRAADNLIANEGRSSALYLEEEIVHQILRIIRCHLGIWSPIPETIPITSLEWTLHVADYLATNLHTIVDGEEIKDQRWK